MIYPTITEYIEAIRFSEDNFDKLANLVPVLKDNGEPYYSSGNFAVVFKMKDKESGKLHAVKCFLKDQEGREESYRKISNYLETIENRYLIKTKFLEKELFVDTKSTDQTEFPVVVMDWVEGVPLDVYIREKINDKMYLEYLCYTFSLMAQNLIEQEFAHGDLKPDNILVKEDGMLVLVDYDGMYVPEMFGERSRELGSPDFQHPDRKLIDFDRHLDDFSLASILLSLKLISIDPSLLDKFGDKDRLLFSQKDYREFPGSEINAEIFKHFENKEVLNIYHLFLQALGRKICVWNKEMWKLEVPCLGEPFLVFDNEERILSVLSKFDVDSKAYYGSVLVEQYKKIEGFGLLNDLMAEENPIALWQLGMRYLEGKGVFKDCQKGFSLISKSVEKGNLKGCLDLGNCYSRGEGVPKNLEKAVELYIRADEEGRGNCFSLMTSTFDIGCKYLNNKDYSKAVNWFRKSADLGEPSALCNLGYCYEFGYGVTKDLCKAVEYYERSAERGVPCAIHNLGECYEFGKGVDKNESKAVSFYIKSAEGGFSESQYRLGLCYEKGVGVDSNSAKAFEWYSKSAEGGYADAQYKLGLLYENGEIVPKNYQIAFEWYTKSANQNNSSAQCKLGVFYGNGCYVSKDLDKAIDWLEMSAKSGNSEALYFLGYYYFMGIGVKADLEKSIECFSRSSECGDDSAKDILYLFQDFFNIFKLAKEGDADSQYYMGNCYEKGKYIGKDFEVAYNWYSKSAVQGNSKAQFKLGLCFENGIGVAPDNNKAFEWYSKSAEQCCSDAQYQLAVCFENGVGVNKDMAMALEWYKKSAEQGNVDAQKKLESFQKFNEVDDDIISYVKLAEQGDAEAQFKVAVYWNNKKDYNTAFEWFYKSAVQGHSESQFWLGVYYMSGYGILKSFSMARKWLASSADQGNTSAQGILKILEAKNLNS